MRLFENLPEIDTRPRTAIVRQLTRDTEFDPREYLPAGIVLTLPFTLDSSMGSRDFVRFAVN